MFFTNKDELGDQYGESPFDYRDDNEPLGELDDDDDYPDNQGYEIDKGEPVRVFHTTQEIEAFILEEKQSIDLFVTVPVCLSIARDEQATLGPRSLTVQLLFGTRQHIQKTTDADQMGLQFTVQSLQELHTMTHVPIGDSRYRMSFYPNRYEQATIPYMPPQEYAELDLAYFMSAEEIAAKEERKDLEEMGMMDPEFFTAPEEIDDDISIYNCGSNESDESDEDNELDGNDWWDY